MNSTKQWSLVFCIVFSSIAAANTPVPAYEHTEELLEKTKVLEMLLIHTYGTANPFLELPYSITWYIDVSKRVMIHAHTHTHQDTLAHAAYTQQTLGTLDSAVSAVLMTFIHETTKDRALKELITLVALHTDWVLMHVPECAAASPAARQLIDHKKRFFMINPASIGTALQFLSASIVGFWLLYLANKAHTYITSPNHELLEELIDDQRQATDDLVTVENILNDSIAMKLGTPPPRTIELPSEPVNPFLHPIKSIRNWWRTYKNNNIRKQATKNLSRYLDDRTLPQEYKAAMNTLKQPVS